MENKSTKRIISSYNSHSSNFISSPTSSGQIQTGSLPSTPQGRPKKTRQSVKKSVPTLVPSTPYAGSGFADSPSARHIPLPPTEWIMEAISSSSASNSDSESSSAYERSSTLGHNPLPESVKTSAAISTVVNANHPVGLRVNPLHLIAAVASS